MPRHATLPAIVVCLLTVMTGPALARDSRPPKRAPTPVKLGTEDPTLLARFQAGSLHGVRDVVFAVRPVLPEHWYANFGYYSAPESPMYFKNGAKLYRDGAKLCRLDLTTGQRTTLFEDPQGGIRDPQVHYDGRKIVFAYRKGGTEYYHLYEINVDGSGLRALTDGRFDDIEPSYLPDGGIVFVSSRCQRWVNCWTTQVAVLYRCDGDGRNVRPLSSNNEHDNTPWPLPDGRILYTRWEYVDRSQVHYHHLWLVDPEGAGQSVYFGNLNPGVVMIDAKPIPGSGKIVCCFSPGHGQTEHAGKVTVVDPKSGPDDRDRARAINPRADCRDPWPFSEDCFLAAAGTTLLAMDSQERYQVAYRLPADEVKAGLQCHEPRPIVARPREPVLATRAKNSRTAGRLILADVYQGRNMSGVARGEIKRLLVLETLPKPINFTGGMEPLSFGGTFTLERILGTVPVEPDGSAYFQVPALRSVFFVALDENNLAVKRMQSFVTVQPGETLSCVGCHEHRAQTPLTTSGSLTAMHRRPSLIEPIAGVPEVMDFPRDIQPILDRHCVRCHDFDRPDGHLVLSGDRGPLYSHSYINLTVRNQFADGRNRPVSNYAPRSLGSAASPLLTMLEPSHHQVQVSAAEKRMVRLWIDTGAPYPGTYAALGSGMVGGYAQNRLDRQDLEWPSTKAAIDALTRRCGACHTGRNALPASVSDDQNRPPWAGMAPDDPRRQFSRHLLYNLTRPEKSPLVLAPLARAAGGRGTCKKPGAAQSADVFASPADPDYQKILAAIGDAKRRLDEIKRFDMPGFRPRPEWVREMKRYGILPGGQPLDAVFDVYAIEHRYWESLWYRPSP
jgi:hypothetical protein